MRLFIDNITFCIKSDVKCETKTQKESGNERI